MMDCRSRRIELCAPAKLNLGLEILGKRPDGFHDIATIFLTVDLCDRLVLSRGVERQAEVSEVGPYSFEPGRHRVEGIQYPGDAEAELITLTCSDPSLSTAENLALRALQALHRESGRPLHPVHLHLDKRIPTAAGLGGASSDAAAALLAGNAYWNLDLSPSRLATLAASLGSDVPFLVGGGCALGHGRGDRLETLPVPQWLCVVLVMPRLTIPRKTARLYASLIPSDFSDGRRITVQADRLRAGNLPDLDLLGNAFARPLVSLVPDLAGLPDILRAAGAPRVGLSGAGPTFYIPLTDPAEAADLSKKIRGRIGDRCAVAIVKPVPPREISAPGISPE